MQLQEITTSLDVSGKPVTAAKSSVLLDRSFGIME
jgi:hypothetical protein